MAGQAAATRRILDGLEAQGARIKRTSEGWQVYCPNGEIVTMHVTPSDHRAMRNARSRVKRNGLHWPLDK